MAPNLFVRWWYWLLGRKLPVAHGSTKEIYPHPQTAVSPTAGGLRDVAQSARERIEGDVRDRVLAAVANIGRQALTAADAGERDIWVTLDVDGDSRVDKVIRQQILKALKERGFKASFLYETGGRLWVRW